MILTLKIESTMWWRQIHCGAKPFFKKRWNHSFCHAETKPVFTFPECHWVSVWCCKSYFLYFIFLVDANSVTKRRSSGLLLYTCIHSKWKTDSAVQKKSEMCTFWDQLDARIHLKFFCRPFEIFSTHLLLFQSLMRVGCVMVWCYRLLNVF